MKTGFPSVPTKERTHAKLSTLSVGLMSAGQQAVSYETAIGGTTVTTDEVIAGLVDNDYVIISGSTNPGYDGVFQVSNVATTEFEITQPFTDNPAQGFVIAVKDMDLIGQASDWSANETFDTDDWSTIGTMISTEPNDVSYPVNMTVYVDKSLSQASRLLGVADPTAEVVAIAPDGSQNVIILLQNYDGRSSSSKLQNYVIHEDVQWSEVQFGTSASDYYQWTLTGEAELTFTRAEPQA